MRTASFLTGFAALLVFTSDVASQGRGGRGSEIPAGEQCPAGTTEIRPRRCMAPEITPPSILDYRPRSTLKVPAHFSWAAKYPVIDFHGHPGALITTPEQLATLRASLDSLNVRMMIAAENMTGDRLRSTVAAINSSPQMKDRVRVLTGISFQNVGPGWAEKAIAQLEADIAAGAVGVGEIGKGFGLSTRKPDGSRLKLDDPELDPIWQAAARLNIPVFIHTGDPAEFFQPLDFNNERWLEMALFPDRRFFDRSRFPAFDDLMAERDRLLAKHPKTTFILAHLGWHAQDLGRLGRIMDKMPNVHAEVGAILYDLGRQPRAAREFFTKYQDRLLFGKDSFEPDEYPYYW